MDRWGSPWDEIFLPHRWTADFYCTLAFSICDLGGPEIKDVTLMALDTDILSCILPEVDQVVVETAPRQPVNPECSPRSLPN
jgi:hypothetical protein